MLGIVLATALAFTAPSAPGNYVNDYAHVLSASTVDALNAELKDFDAATSNQIAVAIVPDMGGDYIEHYAVKLFEAWKVGTAKNDNGVLLVIAVSERKIRIEVGYGLEGALPDSVAQRIITDEISPRLKDGDFDGGITAGVRAIEAATRGEYQGGGGASKIDPEAFFGIIFFGILILQWIVAILARSRSWWAGGLVGGIAGVVVASVFGWWLFGGALATLILAGLGLALDFAVSRAYHEAKARGVRPPWWGGGHMGGMGGGGFGGFGGGSSGGGGASGSF